MSQTEPNVLPDTLEKIRAARSQSSRPWEDRLAPYCNIGEVLSARAATQPDREFLHYRDDNGPVCTYTYGEFDTAGRRVAAFLSERLGIRAGDRVATLMVNDARTVLVYFGAWLLGATVVPVNCGEDDDRVAYILENSEAKAAVVMGDQVERVRRLAETLPNVLPLVAVTEDETSGCIPFREALETEPMAELPPLTPETECLIVYTSGTTGAPKGVVLEQANLLEDAHSIMEWHRFTPDDRAMCVLPIHHVNGMIVTLMTPLYSGGSVVLNRRFRAQAFWQTLAEKRCTWVSVVPTVLAFLCERKDDLSALELSQFRHFICGAGPLTVELARRFDEAFGKRVVHGYGLSETTCYSSFLPVDLDPTKYRHWMTECGFPSIGCPISANEMAIHDAEGRPLEPDARGEIVIRGQNVMKYYFKRPDANKETFAHGWFRSGDEGFFRKGEDGREYFFITGRIKELIIRGGINYSPFDIDEVLNAIPGVKAAMAVGFENSFYGEEIGAYVQREEGTDVTPEEILAACRAELPYAKCPKVVVFGDTFPVTSTGKYQRNKLKPLFAEWREAQFREKKG
jgi:long-chain acyl-CoA synthetase